MELPWVHGLEQEWEHGLELGLEDGLEHGWVQEGEQEMMVVGSSME